MTTSAFLQPHSRPVAARACVSASLLPGTKISLWRVDGARRPSVRSATYPVVLDDSHECATMMVYDTPAIHLGSYPRRILAIAQVLTTIEHPGVAGIVDSGLLADGRPYAVFDAEVGSSLANIITDGVRMDPIRALTIVRAICAPLMAAHELGVVHGSLGLEHVLLLESDDRFVKLLDWGVERAVFDEACRAGIELPSSTACVAPEEALGVRSPQTDAYALGVLAYRLLLGRMPCENAGAPRELWPEMPTELEALLSNLLADEPRRRPTIAAAAEQIAAIHAGLVTAKTSAATSTTVATAPVVDAGEYHEITLRRPRPTRYVAAAMFLAAAAAVLVFATRDTTRMSRADASVSLQPTQARAEPPPVQAITPVPAPAIEPVVTPTVGPTVAARAVVVPAARGVAATPMRDAPRKRAPARDVASTASPDPRNEVLTQYQRVGRALFQLQQKRGVTATAELWQQFRGVTIEPALATTRSRAAAAAVLADVQAKIDRQRGIDVTDACLHNPLADGCR